MGYALNPDTLLTRVCIHQPDFAPYLGFFQRLLLVDHFILLDDVQFIRRGWQHRDQIKSKQGPVWLTLSLAKGEYEQRINEVRLADDPKWIDDNLNLLRECYRHSACFEEIFPLVEEIYRAGYSRLIDFNRAILDLAFTYFQISLPVTLASDYAVTTASSARLVDLVLKISASQYISGTGARDYLDEQLFSAAGIAVQWQQFSHPVYPQLHEEFTPMLSCLDVLFNCGKASADVLRSTLK